MRCQSIHGFGPIHGTHKPVRPTIHVTRGRSNRITARTVRSRRTPLGFPRGPYLLTHAIIIRLGWTPPPVSNLLGLRSASATNVAEAPAQK